MASYSMHVGLDVCAGREEQGNPAQWAAPFSLVTVLCSDAGCLGGFNLAQLGYECVVYVRGSAWL